MLKHSLIAIALILGLFLPSTAVIASPTLPITMGLMSWMMPDEEPVTPATATQQTCEIATGAPSFGVLFTPLPLAMSCSSQCRALYLSCLDGCDAAPFPGCYNHCRFDVLYACYKSCF